MMAPTLERQITERDLAIESRLDAVLSRMAALTRRSRHSIADAGMDAADAALHHIESGGRHLRARLALDASAALGVAADDAIILAVVAELLHNASLVHDDLQDRSRMRRDTETVWAAFGDDVAICTGDLMLSAAYAALARFSDPAKLPALLAMVHDGVSAAISGQCADLTAASSGSMNFACYEAVAAEKSGALLSLPLELVLVAADEAAMALEARKAAETFAVGYQIADDIADLEGDTAGKGGDGSLNAVLLLEASLPRDQALRRARSLARERLAAAAARADALPNRSGALLARAALLLSVELGG